MNKSIWLFAAFLLLTGIVVFQNSQSWAVVPYTKIEPSSTEVKLAKEPNSEFIEKLKKHELQNMHNFEEIGRKLALIKKQNDLVINEAVSWKLISVALFLINLILLIFLGWNIRLKNLK